MDVRGRRTLTDPMFCTPGPCPACREGRILLGREPCFHSSAGESGSTTNTSSSLIRPSCKTAICSVSCFLKCLPRAAVLGQNLRGAPGFQTGWGLPPCSLWLGIIQITNVEHLGNFRAKKRSSWLDMAEIPRPLWCQRTVSGIFCLCCGPNNKATMY